MTPQAPSTRSLPNWAIQTLWALVTLSRAPMASARSRMMPVPSCRVTADWSNPMPSSATLRSTRSPSQRRRTVA